VNYFQHLDKLAKDSIVTSPLETYKLRKGDQLIIKISTLDKDSKNLFSGGNPYEGSGNSVPEIFAYKIFNDGKIDFPYIGGIKLAGLTTREAKDTIKVKLRTLIPDCDVDVRLTNAYFSVIGSAGNGRYDIPKEKLNIFQALAISGDLRSFTDRRKIHLLRQDENGKTHIYTLNVRNSDIINSPYYYIQPNDVIYAQNFSGQFFGIETFSNVLSAVASTFSLSYLIYYSTK
jgi:polysaccharide export outer membrane protein